MFKLQNNDTISESGISFKTTSFNENSLKKCITELEFLFIIIMKDINNGIKMWHNHSNHI